MISKLLFLLFLDLDYYLPNTHLAVHTSRILRHSGVGSVSANPISTSPLSSSAINSLRLEGEVSEIELVAW